MSHMLREVAAACRRAAGKRWVWIVVLFAVINALGLLKIISVLEPSSARLRVGSFQPQGLVIEHERGRPLVSVRFSQPMVAAGGIGKPCASTPVKIAPPIEGTWTWQDASTLQLRPAENLKLATAYTAVVAKDATSLPGEVIRGNRTFRFHTRPLEVVDIRQSGCSDDRRLTLALEFSDQVHPDDLAEHLSLTSGGRTVGFRIATTANRTICLTTDRLPSDSVVARLAKGLRGVAGPLGLEQNVIREVAIDYGISFSGVYAYISYGQSPHISISFTQEIDPKAIYDFIQVEPAAGGAEPGVRPPVRFSVQSTYRGVSLAGPFAFGTRYRVKLLKGLRSANGAILKDDVTRSVVIPDLDPTLRFKTRGIYMASRGSMILPLETINVAEAEVTFEEIYENNVVHFLRNLRDYRQPDGFTRVAATRKYPCTAPQNEPRITNIDLASVLGNRGGAYFVTASDTGSGWSEARQLVLITNVGISAKRSNGDLLVWVNTLDTAQPVAGATVSVFNRENQRLAGATTNDDGIAHMTNAEWSGDRQPFAVVASTGDDLAMIELDRAELDFSTFDTGGDGSRAYLRKGYEAFLNSDRGVYRPGEVVHVHAIVRAPGPALPVEFPVELAVRRPDRRNLRTLTALLSKWGSADFDVSLPDYALTGDYTAELRVPGTKTAVGSVQFLVQEFVPARMKVEIAAADRRFRPGDELAFTVRAAHLFGMPAAGRRVEARCELIHEDFTHDDWDGYDFSDSSKPFPVHVEKLGSHVLDANGEKKLAMAIPKNLNPPSCLTAVLTATVMEAGGRAVTVSISRPVDARPFYVGLARTGDAPIEPNQPCEFACAVVSPAGTPAGDVQLDVTVSRIVWHTVLKLDNGRYRYESEREAQQAERLACTVAGGRGTVAFIPAEIGEYEIRAGDPKTGASADLTFYCTGAGYAAWSMEKPERIELLPDKPCYAPGDAARIMLKSPFPGRALVTIETDHIHSARTMTLAGNTAELTIPIDESLGPNAYCSVTVIRPVASDAQLAMHRAYGVVPILLDHASRRLQVDVRAPADIRPGQHLQVEVAVRDAAGTPVPAELTVAAVDEGICSLTGYQTPDPWAFFCARRVLGVGTSDVYSLLMPEVGRRKVESDSDAGGDGDEKDFDPRRLNPISVRRIKPIALWQSNLETGPDGRSTVEFTAPDFSGQLRLMVVSAAAAQFGSTQRSVFVRQPLMLTTSFPRFLAPGDEFVVPVTLTNNTGQAADAASARARVKIVCEGPLEALGEHEVSVELADGAERALEFRLRALRECGRAAGTVSASLGEHRAVESVELAVRPPSSLQATAQSGAIPAGTSATIKLPGGWLAGTGKCSITFSAMPQISLAGGLRYLVRYPYGCVEQTVSSAFPLLYLADVAEFADPETFRKTDPQAFAQAGVDRLLAMQTATGGFAMWPGYGSDGTFPWGSVYAAHFLVEARNAGYDVPEDALKDALSHLAERCLSGYSTSDDEIPVKAYACCVLALAGKPNRSWTWRLYEDREHLPAYSRCHVAAALATMGDRKTALAMLAEDRPEKLKVRAVPEQAGMLDSPAREVAIQLAAYLDAAPDHPSVPVLARRLQSLARDGRWATTQENAFALLALGRYVRRTNWRDARYEAEATANGRQLARFTQDDKPVIELTDASGTEVRVKVAGTGMLHYCCQAEGVPVEGQPAVDRHLKVRRQLLARDGKPLDPLKIPHGAIVIMEIAITSEHSVRNLVVSDLLPACFEIENPRIASSDSLAWADESRGNCIRPDRVEMRDDRLLLFTDINSGRESIYRYVARAVTRGRFTLPAITASCMYDPDVISVNGAGTVNVVDAK